MTKSRLGLTVVLGLLFTAWSQAQVASEATAATADVRCEQAAQTMENERANCSEYTQKVIDLNNQMAALRKQRDELRAQCLQSGQKKSADCEAEAALLSGRVFAMEQTSIMMLQQGCQQTAVSPASMAKTCSSGARANFTIADQNRLNRPTNPANALKSSPVTASKDQMKVPRRTDVGANGSGQQPAPRRIDSGGGGGQMTPQGPRQSLGDSGGGVGRGPIASPAAAPNTSAPTVRMTEPK